MLMAWRDMIENPYIADKIILGSAAFGLNYGIGSNGDSVSGVEVRSILDTAFCAGIKYIDTAALYGTSENILGSNLKNEKAFNIITKLPPINIGSDVNNYFAQIHQLLQKSLNKLNLIKIYGLLLHRASDLYDDSGLYVYESLAKLKDLGLVEKIGVSIYASEDYENIPEDFIIDIVQLPFNLFDQRLIQNGYLKHLRAMNIEIHARSVFLQGLLLLNPSTIPNKLISAKRNLEVFNNYLDNYNICALDACLNYVYSNNEIDYAVVGVHSNKQLIDILSVKRTDISFDTSVLAVNDINIVDPRRWSKD